MTPPRNIDADRDGQRIVRFRKLPRPRSDAAGQVIEVHHLLDDAGGQVVVEPHDLAPDHRYEMARQQCRQLGPQCTDVFTETFE